MSYLYGILAVAGWIWTVVFFGVLAIGLSMQRKRAQRGSEVVQSNAKQL